MVQYGRILVPKMVTKSKKHIFPELTQKGLETVPIASGGPGNLFLYYNNVLIRRGGW